jgi:phenylacetate-CoA ligase
LGIGVSNEIRRSKGERMYQDDAYWDPGVETMSREEIREHQFKKLLSHLKYAYEHCRYYRDRFNSVGLKPSDIKTIEDYYRIPFSTKSDLIENQRKDPPFGDTLGVDPDDLTRIYLAPGPIAIPFTNEDFDNFSNVFAKGLYVCGARKQDIVNVTTTFHWVVAGDVVAGGLRKIGSGVIPGGAGMSNMHIEMMKWTKTSVICGFTTFVEHLGNVAQEMGIDPKRDLSVRLVIIFGDIRKDETIQKIKETFGAEVREFYASADLGIIAAGCPEGGGMHLNEDYVVEIIDPETGVHVPWGETGEIAASEVCRKAMPIIRYRTGDITEGINMEPCPCGRTSPRLKRILGRKSEIAKVKGMFVNPRDVERVLRKYPKLGRFQIIVDRSLQMDELTVKVECSDIGNLDDLRNILVSELKETTRLTANILLVNPGNIPESASVLDDKRRV